MKLFELNIKKTSPAKWIIVILINSTIRKMIFCFSCHNSVSAAKKREEKGREKKERRDKNKNKNKKIKK